jgi:hypothetical protein
MPWRLLPLKRLETGNRFDRFGGGRVANQAADLFQFLPPVA